MKHFFTAVLCFWAAQLMLSAQLNTTGSINFEGLQRDYMLYVPASYNPATPVPLLLNLHGYGSINWQQDFYGDFKPIADTANFIIATPNGTPDTTGSLYWNVGFFPSQINDVGFLSALIDTLSASYNIDQSRLYSAGMSNGGFMGYTLACNTNRFAAIASVTGSMTTPTFNNCNPQKPTPVIEIHGTADPTVPYNGTALFSPIEEVVNFWVQYNNCNPTPQITALPDTNTGDSATAEQYLYSGGDNGTSVEFYKVINGAHTWPGAPINFGGPTCMDFSASVAIWHFFNQNINTSTAIPASGNLNPVPALEVFPNPANEQLYLSWPQQNTNQTQNTNYMVNICNLQGQIIEKYNLPTHSNNGQPSRIDISRLPAGTYIITAANEQHFFANKIAVK